MKVERLEGEKQNRDGGKVEKKREQRVERERERESKSREREGRE